MENGQPAPPEIRRKPRRIPADRAFFIAKEMLSTERTYRTDLRILNVVSWAPRLGRSGTGIELSRMFWARGGVS